MQLIREFPEIAKLLQYGLIQIIQKDKLMKKMKEAQIKLIFSYLKDQEH